MEETKIFDTALKCLLGIQLIVDNSQLVHLNDEDLLKLHKCLTFKEKFENQTVDVKIALRLCPTEDADESLWFEQKIYQILGHPIPIYRVFGEKREETFYRYSIYFVDDETDMQRNEVLTFTEKYTIHDVVSKFKDLYKGIYYEYGIIDCYAIDPEHVTIYTYNGQIIQEGVHRYEDVQSRRSKRNSLFNW